VTGEHRAAALQRVLAEDPAIAELGIDATIGQTPAGDVTIVLSGQVETAERRSAIEQRVRDEAPDCHVVSDILVIEPTLPAEPEVLP